MSRVYKVGAVALVVVALGSLFVHEVEGGKKVKQHVFEMRTYYAHPGRMKALHARFRDHTCKIFEKHNMKMVGFWSPIDEKEAEEKLVYILEFPSVDAAKKAWADFRVDPDWIKARDASEADGKIVARVVSVFLNPTDYSPIK